MFSFNIPARDLRGWAHLTEAVLVVQRLYTERLHKLNLLLVEVLHLVHRYHTVPVQVHAPQPVLDADGANRERLF